MIINNRLWEICFVSPERMDSLGICDGNTSRIYIQYGLNPQKLKKVLCHEIVHAAMISYNVRLTIEQEEMVADLIATFGGEILDLTNEIFADIT